VLGLVDSDEKYRGEFVAALREFAEALGERIFDRYETLISNFEAYVQHLLADQGQPPTRTDRVPASVLWLVDDGAYLGQVNLRID
jgi:predicted acetyltransferase